MPNAHLAQVHRAKLVDYLLSESHPIGRWKARWFRALGFDSASANELEAELLRIAATEEVSEVVKSPFGVKYLIRGALIGPSGTIASIETVWMIELDQDAPRLVTAYPTSPGGRA